MNLQPAQRTLDNGLKVVCVEKHSAPVVAVQVWFRTGSAAETVGQHGISHMLEHMMFRGSEHVPSEHHAQRINEVGGHCNAYTSEDVTVYMNSVPRDCLQMVLDLEADRFRGLLLKPGILETERRVIVEEYHTYMNNPVAKAFLEFRSVFYGDHPYALSPLGTIEDIQTVSVEQCRAYYDRWYAPENAVLIVAGDFDGPDSLFEMAEAALGRLRGRAGLDQGEPPAGAAVHDIGHTGTSWTKRRVEFDVPMVITGYPAPASAGIDALHLEILQVIASQGETSRLHGELVRRRGMAVMAGGMNHLLRMPGMSLFFAAYTPDIASKRVELALNREVDGLLRDGITPAELEKVRNSALAHRSAELYSVDNICRRLGHAETIEGDHRLWLERLKALDNLREDQVVETARKYWAPEFRHTLHLWPRKVNPLLFGAGILRRLVPGR